VCGIVGFVGLDRDPAESPAHLRRMLAALRHRGPDEQGWYFDEHIGLGTARLSIIDLATGSQPMSTDDGHHWIVFNGEIFNYLELRAELEALGHGFRTRSDTEVLLRAIVQWGCEALPRLNGQFAFAWYDRRERRVLLARDPFGERPLFHARAAGGLVFASEIKALFALPFVPRQISRARLRRLFELWTALPEETCFEDVDALPPGHCAVVDADGSMRVEAYYRLPRGPAVDADVDLGAAVERVRSALDESVRLRLRSDVEVGTYLSGGLDSSITTYLAQKNNTQPVRTFAIEFEDAGYDERQYQRMLQQKLGTRHHAVRITHVDIARSFPEVIWHAETALFRTAPVPMFLLSRHVHEQGIKVVLTGEGADEAFLGYDIFKETLVRSQIEALSAEERIAAVHGLYPYLRHFTPANASMLARSLAEFGQERIPGLFSHEMRFANGRFAIKLLGPAAGGTAEEDVSATLADRIRAIDPALLDRPLLERAQVIEYATLLAGYLLSSQGDRMTSANSVEGRCPFLDPDVVAAAFALPIEVRLRGGKDEKHVLKAAFREVLPPAIVERPKQPYRAPDACAFTHVDSVDWIDDVLAPESIRASGLFDAAFAISLVDRLRKLPAERISPREDQAFVLLVSTLLLQRQFETALPEEPYRRPLTTVREIDGRRSRG
jgi:asparagine synthase (glutamine-hydrolysing)